MIIRSFDPEVMKHGFELSPEKMPSSFSYEGWLEDTRNVMLVKGENVGLATHEYPGVYTVHWFFTERGRGAINLAKEMLDELFKTTDAQTIRGLTPVDLKAARWLAKQVGLKSHGVMEFADGKECEVMFITKEEFYNNGHR
jgi:hypothetical protein